MNKKAYFIIGVISVLLCAGIVALSAIFAENGDTPSDTVSADKTFSERSEKHSPGGTDTENFVKRGGIYFQRELYEKISSAADTDLFTVFAESAGNAGFVYDGKDYYKIKEEISILQRKIEEAEKLLSEESGYSDDISVLKKYFPDGEYQKDSKADKEAISAAFNAAAVKLEECEKLYSRFKEIASANDTAFEDFIYNGKKASVISSDLAAENALYRALDTLDIMSGFGYDEEKMAGVAKDLDEKSLSQFYSNGQFNKTEIKAALEASGKRCAALEKEYMDAFSAWEESRKKAIPLSEIVIDRKNGEEAKKEYEASQNDFEIFRTLYLEYCKASGVDPDILREKFISTAGENTALPYLEKYAAAEAVKKYTEDLKAEFAKSKETEKDADAAFEEWKCAHTLSGICAGVGISEKALSGGEKISKEKIISLADLTGRLSESGEFSQDVYLFAELPVK